MTGCCIIDPYRLSPPGGGGGTVIAGQGFVGANNNGNNVTVSLSGLSTGETLILVAFAADADPHNNPPSVVTAGWTEHYTEILATPTAGGLLVATKTVGGTPDTSVEVANGENHRENSMSVAVLSAADVSTIGTPSTALGDVTPGLSVAVGNLAVAWGVSGGANPPFAGSDWTWAVSVGIDANDNNDTAIRLVAHEVAAANGAWSTDFDNTNAADACGALVLT